MYSRVHCQGAVSVTEGEGDFGALFEDSGGEEGKKPCRKSLPPQNTLDPQGCMWHESRNGFNRYLQGQGCK